ncbi:MAG: biopolymer transporter ExbD [Proteobacteria bacterium]|nr:biopolymer transporter ExbD [Pseudomonadota bacterium]
MSKKISDPAPAPSLDLTPIMNMVLCLIPLMLLSVVFMTICVIDVTMPQRSAGAASSDGEPPKRLQLFISKQGFTIVEGMTTLSAVGNCASDGPTICLKNEKAELDVDKHDWRALYNELFRIKQKGEWSDHKQIDIVADPSVNYGVLVKAMDISRYQLVPRADFENASKGKEMKSDDELNDSLAVLHEETIDGEQKKVPLDMFPLVVLGLPTMN